MAPPHRVELSPINAGDPAEMERGIAAFARTSNAGLAVTVGGTAVRRDVIVAAAAKYRLPAIYPYRYFVFCRRLRWQIGWFLAFDGPASLEHNQATDVTV